MQGNKADVFGNDIYMESWVATPAYFNPYPTSAREWNEMGHAWGLWYVIPRQCLWMDTLRYIT